MAEKKMVEEITSMEVDFGNQTGGLRNMGIDSEAIRRQI